MSRKVDLSKVPPSNPDAEQSILAAILYRPERLEEVVGVLSPEDFYAPEHRIIFKAMQDMNRQGRGIDLVTLADALARSGQPDRVSRVYLAELTGGLAGNYAEASRIVREMAARRRLIDTGLALADSARDLSRDIAKTAQIAVEAAASAELGRKGSGPKGFKLLTLREILEEPRPTRWLIRDHLAADSLAILFGEAGTMKSFVALDMGLCIASGLPWHGFACPNPGPVFYIAGEGFAGLAKRIRAWTLTHEVMHENLPFFLSSEPARLLDDGHALAVRTAAEKLADQHGQPKLIVIDTLNRNFGPGDENSSADMTAFVAALDRIKAQFSSSALVVHHAGLQAKDRGRGSSVLKAAADFEYRLSTRGNARMLSCTKAKDHVPPPEMAFEPEEIGCGWPDPESGGEVMSCVLRLADSAQVMEQAELTGTRRIAYDALLAACERSGGASHINVWREEAYSRGISSGGSDARKKAFKRAFDDLETLGFMKRAGEGLWLPAR